MKTKKDVLRLQRKIEKLIKQVQKHDHKGRLQCPLIMILLTCEWFLSDEHESV